MARCAPLRLGTSTDTFNPGKLKAGTEEIDLATTKNVKWVAKLGSQSYGNPTIANGRVYVGTNNDSPRDKRHLGDRSILLCLDEKTGEMHWQLVVPKLKSGKVNDWESLGLLSSPTIEGDRVYVVTSRCEVLCLSVDGMAKGNQGPYKDEAKYAVLDIVGPDGKPAAPIPPGPKDADILWRYDMMDELGVFPHNASNCSVLIVGDVLYVCTSNGQDWTHVNIPSPLSPSLIAINKKTGELLGEDDAKIGSRLFHGQWSSPSTGKVNGKDLIFFRNRPDGEGETLADLVHQTAMYYQDRLGGQGFGSVLLAGEGRDAADLASVQRELESRLGGTVERLDPRRVVAVADRVHGTTEAAAVIPPLCGILLREIRDRQVA